MTNQVHRVAQTGFGEGTNELYDTYRPTYPNSQLDYIFTALGNPVGPLNVLELGSGTGIFTRCLLAHEALGPVVGKLDAVEPSAGMRARFSETIRDGRVSCREGVFESTGAVDGWADLVVIAQAWHWCPDFDKALTEIARVLQPGGLVVFIWNLEDMDVPWVAKNRHMYERYEQGTPQFRLGLWRQMFNAPAIQNFKTPHEEHEVVHTVPTTLKAVIERVFTKSYVAVLPESEKALLRKDIHDNTVLGEGRTWIDEENGIWEYPHKNLVVLLQKK
ncbi:hypothetical protein FRB99_005572 [Tulasnella sp. 403]|nr:hypothetical protein FRB99_005572 [Tulasnella sp. 403]